MQTLTDFLNNYGDFSFNDIKTGISKTNGKYVEIPDRMTDSDWRRKIGMEMNDDMEYNMGDDVPNPEWTDMYRYKYVYEGDY